MCSVSFCKSCTLRWIDYCSYYNNPAGKITFMKVLYHCEHTRYIYACISNCVDSCWVALLARSDIVDIHLRQHEHCVVARQVPAFAAPCTTLCAWYWGNIDSWCQWWAGFGNPCLPQIVTTPIATVTESRVSVYLRLWGRKYVNIILWCIKILIAGSRSLGYCMIIALL